jgi:type IV secretory pathway VirB10-like protein
MLQKHKIVVLKKTWILIVGGLITVIVVLILSNLYKASHRHARSKTLEKIHALASQTDTHWYQQQTVAELPSPQIVSPVPSLKQENEFSEDDLNAMSTPINSHQLKADVSSVTSLAKGATAASGTSTDQNKQGEKKAFIQINEKASNDNVLSSPLQELNSPFELQAGSVIPGVLMTGISSDLPGQVIAQVRTNVYDSPAGKYLLIPQGSRLTGVYDSQITYGQQRILIVWKRIVFPNGQSIDLQSMPGIDMGGYAGFHDEVNNHYMRLFGSAILMSMVGIGAQLAAPQSNDPFAPVTVKQALAQSLNTNLTNTSSSITAKNLNIQPTLHIRPGYEFNISVTKDMVFPKPYHS